ncbi:copper-binding protein [Gloeocapsopsis crepidinum LEGE 06123]|uniref:Copper-binding protein n=1 Tax=Gloeocapsopsis crepidinum LEGE 06123 TaxID=588587 RepID=A0ABR9UYS7_9CHRO|nr:sulfocyanin-like copper-binding protein [Gloeocapsopsis crepidinum]MBE9193472.1 copper-binding protein [Gloeocapsopsis crepidinum LEGE 06123]
MLRRILLIGTFLLVLIIGVDQDAIAAQTVTQVKVIETEMAIELSPSTVSAGEVEFIAYNQGQLPHEMEIIKTDLPLAQMPIKDNRLDRKKVGEKIDEIEAEDLPSGATATLLTHLEPGRYLIECNIPGHFQAGMKAELIVM